MANRKLPDQAEGRAIRSPWLSDDDLPFVLAFVAVCAFASVLPAQSDTFYHLRSGREMWESGWFLEQESFSHTAAGRPLHNHWWLSQLLMYGLFSLGGPRMVTAVIGGCALVALYLSWSLVRGGVDTRIVACLGLIVVFPQWSLRPQVFSMLMLMLVVRLVLAGRMVWVPLVMLVWANAHALVVLGIVVPAAAAAEAVLWSRYRLWSAILTVAASAAVPVISPLGLHYWPRAFETVQSSRLLGIDEYRSAFAAGGDALWLWVMLSVFVVMVARAGPRLGQLEAGDRILLITAAVFGLAALVSIRNAGFFALIAVPALSRLAPPVKFRHPRPLPRPALGLIAAAVIIAGTFVVYRWRNDAAYLGWKPIGAPAMAAIRACAGPLYNDFNEGGVLTWFVPERPVFVDGRIEAYPSEFLQRAARATLSADYQVLFKDFNIQCAAVATPSRMAKALWADTTMRLTFSDAQWSVFAR